MSDTTEDADVKAPSNQARDRFIEELQNTGVISDKFKNHLMAIFGKALEIAFNNGAGQRAPHLEARVEELEMALTKKEGELYRLAEEFKKYQQQKESK